MQCTSGQFASWLYWKFAMIESSPMPVNPCSGVPPLNRMHMSWAAIPESPPPSAIRTTTFKREFERNTWVPSLFGQVRAFAIAAAPSVGVVRDPDCGTKYDSVVLGTAAWPAGASRAAKTKGIHFAVGELMAAPFFQWRGGRQGGPKPTTQM